jgi:hypothetical protein
MESFVAFFERPIYPATSVKIRFGQVLEMFFLASDYGNDLEEGFIK